MVSPDCDPRCILIVRRSALTGIEFLDASAVLPPDLLDQAEIIS